MEKFQDIYSFTTESISSYMNGLDLEGKKVVIVTGSSDHILNSVLNGADEVLTFDINGLAKYYMDLKLAGVKYLPFDMFLKVFLYRTKNSFDYNVIKNLPMPYDSKLFWLGQLRKYNNNGCELRDSDLFHINYFGPKEIIESNLYLDKRNFRLVKKRLKGVKIKYVNTNLRDLTLDKEYDYMFLSNISDYLETMFDGDYLENYKKLLDSFLVYVKQIYFAYLYDIGANRDKKEMYDVSRVKEVFGRIGVDTFPSVFEHEGKGKRDGILVLRKQK